MLACPFKLGFVRLLSLACLFVLARFLSLTVSRRMKVPGPVLFFVLLFLVGLSVAVLIELGDTLWQDRWTDKQVYFVGAIWVVSLVTVLAVFVSLMTLYYIVSTAKSTREAQRA